MIINREEIFLKSIVKDLDLNFKSKKKLLVVGAGGVGSVICELLIRSGFNNLTIVDNDMVDETNIQRQIYFRTDIGRYKVDALKDYLYNINNNVNITVIKDILSKENISKVSKDIDLIVDATDNFQTRRLINDFCELEGKDWIYNGAIKGEIISCLFIGKEKKFNNIFPKEIKDESCCEFGVLASTTFISASICFNKILKYFLNIEDNFLIKYNIWNNQFFKIKI
jgi:adenylyltransferase/sulfurtransferase